MFNNDSIWMFTKRAVCGYIDIYLFKLSLCFYFTSHRGSGKLNEKIFHLYLAFHDIFILVGLPIIPFADGVRLYP
jgi:hypothetical protein